MARREWEPVGASPLNQPLPFAPVVDFEQLLRSSSSSAKSSSSSSTPPAPRNATRPAAGGGGSPPAVATISDKGDTIRHTDLVLFITSGLQHLPGSEDAPVTPTSGPAIGFWLRPFNYFAESAAIRQPGSVVYIPAISVAGANAAAAASSAAPGSAAEASFSLAASYGLTGPDNASAAAAAARGLGVDDAALVMIADGPTLTLARRGIQPFVGVPISQTCLPAWQSVPAFNGSYMETPSAPDASAEASGGARADAAAGSGATTGAGAGSGGRARRQVSAAAGEAGPSGRRAPASGGGR